MNEPTVVIDMDFLEIDGARMPRPETLSRMQWQDFLERLRDDRDPDKEYERGKDEGYDEGYAECRAAVKAAIE